MQALFFCLFITSNLYGFCFKEAGQLYNLNPQFLKAIAIIESRLNPTAIHYNKNKSFDIGLMQINSFWRKYLGEDWQYISDPCFNVKVGAWILKQCLISYRNDIDTISCYHTGRPLKKLKGANRKRTIQYIRKIFDLITRKGNKIDG